MKLYRIQSLISAALIITAAACGSDEPKTPPIGDAPDTVATAVKKVELPVPFTTPSVKNFSKVIGWSGNTPTVPAGFSITKFADSLNNPRWIYQASNGDIFVAESNSPHSTLEKVTGQKKSADRILLLRDADKNGVADGRSEFLRDLNKPFGMLVLNNQFYVGNTDGVEVFPYKEGDEKIAAKGKYVAKVPEGPRHWTRNIIANKAGSKIYIAVGSGSDHAENGIDKEENRACIIEINPDGSGRRVFAGGLRNPVGMAWYPGSSILWTSVNERDELGDNLVPDYLTSVMDGGFYGWPYSYYGNNKDPRIKEQRDDLVSKAIVPDISLGNHTASLGLTFYDKDNFGPTFKNGAFIAQHGSWNRSSLSGYKVVFVPFKNGKPSGDAQDFVTGFIANQQNNEVFGRPVGITTLQDGSLLIADDAGGTIWKISKK